MSDAVLSVEQAVQILLRFQEAAPASASRKLGRVIDLLQSQHNEINQLVEQLMQVMAELDRLSLSSDNRPSAPALDAAPTTPAKRTVTDQLADIFDLINTNETGALPHSNPLDAMIAERSLEIPPVEVAEDDTAEFTPQSQPPTLVENDPMGWLKEALPHLLLSEEEAEQVQETIRVVTARLKTTPIFDVVPLMQQTLRPTIMLVREHAERLYMGKMGSMTTEQIAAVRLIRDHVDSAVSLLDSAELVMALQQSRFRVELSTFLCTDLIRRARDMMQAGARAREQRIAIYPPDRPLYAHADFDASVAILIDLLDNAIRYTHKGGAIRLTIDDLGTHVVINVADNGIGLTEEDTANVGKPFWRAAHQPLVRDNPGSGLRLYLAERILALQGGELIFSGEPNVGSTFSFTLPAAPADTVAV
jgi:signal transduction histidine kinase